jgi:hypothetical protein
MWRYSTGIGEILVKNSGPVLFCYYPSIFFAGRDDFMPLKS